MITGCHIIIYSTDPEADRGFFRDTLGFAHVDAGDGWLIFAVPPSEAAFHPAEQNNVHEFYFMCDDLAKQVDWLRSRNISCGDVVEAGWGIMTTLRLPGGGDIGLYQPRHPVAAGR
jgi:catechol 2,3-dioxygenase-like lactoylglutathione lyase family enzyme